MAASVDQLVGLRVEFDLADAAAALLEIEARADEVGAPGVRADLRGQPADFGDRAEVEALAPDERTDRVEESLSGLDVAGAGARANEGRPLPGERRAFVVGQRGVDRNGERADFGRGPQPQIDAEDIA